MENIDWKKKPNGIKVENESLDASELLIEETNDIIHNNNLYITMIYWDISISFINCTNDLYGLYNILLLNSYLPECALSRGRLLFLLPHQNQITIIHVYVTSCVRISDIYLSNRISLQSVIINRYTQKHSLKTNDQFSKQ